MNNDKVKLIEDNLEILQQYFFQNEGWDTNDDNFNPRFDAWAENKSFEELNAIVVEQNELEERNNLK